MVDAGNQLCSEKQLKGHWDQSEHEVGRMYLDSGTETGRLVLRIGFLGLRGRAWMLEMSIGLWVFVLRRGSEGLRLERAC